MAFRFATCNELFQKRPFSEGCRAISDAGYKGIEIAPFTLAPDPAALSLSERVFIKKTMLESGLEFVGLHWLLAAPEGLHATSKDLALRKRTWQYVGHFLDLSADLASGASVVVFGSPKQRGTRDGMNPRDATQAFVEGLASVAKHAEDRGVILLVEALSPDQCDVITSLAEAVDIVKQINSPAVQTMFDTHNAVAESVPHSELVRQYYPYLKHIHVNEMDGKEPGMGTYDFCALLRTLADLDYQGWVSLEAFDFTRNPVEVLTRAIAHLQAASR